MKIVIQSQNDRSFWKHASDWTSNLDEAHDFETAVQAQEFCREHRLEKVQVIVKFDRMADIVFHVA